MYSIFWKGENVGTVQVRICGLYYRFSCSCQPPGEGLYEICLQGNDRELSLGICVPKGGDFGLEKSVPIKQAGEGPFCFLLRKRGEKTEQMGVFAPVEEGRPFPYIHKLKNARLSVKDGVVGITYSESSKPTGQ